jgi:FMN phosphatase YigB (HAD superfamily)
MYARAKLDVDNSNTIFVGDSLKHDVLGAHNAGLISVLLKTKTVTTMTGQPDWAIARASS